MSRPFRPPPVTGYAELRARCEAAESRAEQAEAEVERLKAQEEFDDDLRDACVDKLLAAEASISLLKGALEPFAGEFGDDIPRPDDFPIFGNLVLGDFRRAAQVLADLGGDNG